MSAIAAIMRRHGCSVDPRELRAMRDAAAAAGPDGGGLWTDERVGLGHCLLVTTPESRDERQPRSLGGDVWITADARIDNRTELIDALCKVDDFDGAAATDDELIARAYDAWGLDCLPRLLGDFAFVIWDARQRRLLAVRDCFGIRPLHYFADADKVLVASSIVQILTDTSVPRTLDDEVIQDWLLLGRRKRREATFYAAILQVPAGHYLLVGNDCRPHVRAYWEWREPPPIRYRSRREYAEHFYSVFSEAVRARMRAVGPVGLFLSGGLDSASVAGMAARLLPEQGRPAKTLRTYSFVYDETPQCDERRYIKPLLHHLGIESVYLRPERYELFAEGHAPGDEPDDSDAYEPWWTDGLRDLREHGGRVMLTGFGGETVLLSQSTLHFADWFLAGEWRVLRRELIGYRREKGHWPRISWRALASRLVPRAVRSALPSIPGTPGPPPWVPVSRFPYSRQVRRWRAGRPLRRFHSLAKQFAFELVAGSPEAEGVWPACGAVARRVGVEHAHPFLDRRLHEFVYAVPLEQFFDGALDRVILREMLRGKELLPEEVWGRRGITLHREWHAKLAARLGEVVMDLWDPAVSRWVVNFGGRLDQGLLCGPYREELIYLALFLYWYRGSVECAQVGNRSLEEESRWTGSKGRPAAENSKLSLQGAGGVTRNP